MVERAATQNPDGPGVVRPSRVVLQRLGSLRPGGLVSVMARREGLRFLASSRGRQSLALGVACVLAAGLLIPLHRSFGLGGRAHFPYFPAFAIAVQLGLLIAAARAVWVGLRQDMAAGSLDELLLTGARASELLLGKWLGTGAAASLWTVALSPGLVLAGAVTGQPPLLLSGVLLCWLLAGWTGALLGTLAAVGERSQPGQAGPWMFVFQIWLFGRILLPRLGSGFPLLAEVVRGIHQADPLTLLPAVLGLVREPAPLKVLVLLVLLGTAAVWLAASERSLPGLEKPRPSTPAAAHTALVALRPVRTWLHGSRAEESPRYDGRDVLYRFERVFGWRLRMAPPAWLCVLALAQIPSAALAVLGPEGRVPAAVLLAAEAGAAAVIAGLGMAASLAGEREKGRWVFLLCTPRPVHELLLAKWRAVWLETWPWWVSGARVVVLCLAGTLPWTALPVGLVAAPLAAGVAAGLTAGLCAAVPSLTAAQQRASVLLAGPAGLGIVLAVLLPGLPGSRFLAAPWVVFEGLARPEALAPTLLALAAYGLLGAGGLGVAGWQLRRMEG